MSAVWYISDTEEIVKASWSFFQHDCVADFKLSERSPLPPALSARDLLWARTQISNVCRIRSINCHPVESNEDSAPESISNTQNLLNWNGDFDNPNDSNDDCAADLKFDIAQDNGIEDTDSTEQQDASAAPNVPGLIRPTQKLQIQAE